MAKDLEQVPVLPAACTASAPCSAPLVLLKFAGAPNQTIANWLGLSWYRTLHCSHNKSDFKSSVTFYYYYYYISEITWGCVFWEVLHCCTTGRLGSTGWEKLNKTKSSTKHWLWGTRMPPQMHFVLKTTYSSIHHAVFTTFWFSFCVLNQVPDLQPVMNINTPSNSSGHFSHGTAGELIRHSFLAVVTEV